MAGRRRVNTAPVIAPLRLGDLEAAEADSIEPRLDYWGQRYRAAQLGDRDLGGVEFHGCEFVGLAAGEANMRGSRFVEVRIERLDAAVLRVARSSWRDVVIEGSRVGAAEMYESDVASVRIVRSKLDFVNLRSAKIRDVAFEDCVIGEIDLGQSRVERVSFAGCTLGDIRFDGARMRAVDLRGAHLSVIGGVASMAGVVVTPEQAAELAPVLAAHLGILLQE